MSENKLAYKKMPTEELVVLSQQEDFKALEALIKKIQSDVYATLSYLIKNPEHIPDLTQDILCFKGWLNNIITNTYYDFVRKHKRTPETISIDYTCEPLDIQFKIELPDKKVKPIEKCISSECEKFIKEAIKNLPESFRIAIILREFQGLSYEEIAQTTNSSIGTVKSRISRARIKLQEALKNYI